MPDDALHDEQPAYVRTHELLELVLAEVRALRAELKTEPGVLFGHPGTADTDLLAALLPLIAVAFGERVFTTADVYTAAERNHELKRALIDVGGANRTGRLLRAARGHSFAGYCVQAIGEDRCGVVWRLVTAGRNLDR